VCSLFKYQLRLRSGRNRKEDFALDRGQILCAVARRRRIYFALASRESQLHAHRTYIP
jgi:hypothetical protein